jgi:uncharacterized protein (DUF1697 family)
MTTYIALLRGINVSGRKQVKMETLRTMIRELGFEAVSTYIQSGNIVFRANHSDSKTLGKLIEHHIQKTFDHEVPVLVISIHEFMRIFNLNPFNNPDSAEQNRLYYVLLFKKPAPEQIAVLNNERFDMERFVIATDCVYLSCQNGYGNAKLNNNLVENKLKVVATTRNHRTMIKLIEMANAIS